MNEEFQGEICGFNDYGTFVQLKDVFIEGYLPFSNMGHEMLTFDEARMAALGYQGKVRYKLGDSITVYVVSVDVFEGKIEFSL
jgi:ribonuclease R